MVYITTLFLFPHKIISFFTWIMNVLLLLSCRISKLSFTQLPFDNYLLYNNHYIVFIFFIFWVSCVLCELVFARYCSSLFLFFLYLLISGDFMRLWKIHGAIFLMITFEYMVMLEEREILNINAIYHQRETLGFNPPRGAFGLFLVFNFPHFPSSCVRISFYSVYYRMCCLSWKLLFDFQMHIIIRFIHIKGMLSFLIVVGNYCLHLSHQESLFTWFKVLD